MNLNKKSLTMIAAAIIMGVILAIAVTASTQTKKPEFHIFNLQYHNNTQNNPPTADQITFNIQNLGEVPATNITVDFVFTVQCDLVAGGEFTYNYTYTRDILYSKEVRDGALQCGILEICHKHKLDLVDSSGFLTSQEAIQFSNETKNIYTQLLEAKEPLNPDELTLLEKEALMYWKYGYSEMQPAYYVITCAEGIVEVFPFPMS